MKKVGLLIAACCVVATACSDQPAETRVAGPSFLTTTASTCISTSAIEDGIRAIFPSGGDRSSALSRFRQINRELGSTPPGPDTSTAQTHALNLVDFILQKYEAGRLIGGQSVTTQATLAQVLNGILCTSGLQPVFGPGSLGPDGAAAFIYPTTPDTTVVTETMWAGVQIPAASVNVPTLVTIQRLPDSPGPLLTQLDQYPLFYEYHSTSGSFLNDVLVGNCLASNAAPPDPTRLRLAHNVAPYTMGSIQILPLATAPFLDCTNAPIASAGGRWGFDLARTHGWLERGIAFVFLPKPLYAAGTGGVGGTVRTFSPFGAVDTLAVVSPASLTEVHSPSSGTVASPTASIYLRTPTGKPMVGIGITFTASVGGGSVTGGSTLTDVNGQASVGSWTLGTTQRRNELLVTPAPMQGAGYLSSGFEVPFAFLGFPRTFP